MEAIATGRWLTRARVHRIAVVSAAAVCAMLLFLWLGRSGTVDALGRPVGSDFTAFWNAGRIASAGRPADVWDQQLLNAWVTAAHGVPYETTWTYPPVFLLIAAPLAALPYLPALLLWQVGGFVAVTATLRRILGNWPDTLVALASPMTVIVLAHGQNAFLTAALLGGGLLLLDRRPVLAGLLLGALVYKPQLGLVIGPLLLFTRNRRALTSAALSACGLIAASTLLWGVESWTGFAASLDYARTRILEQGAVGFAKGASLFSMARGWGASIDVSYAVQGVGTAVALLVLWQVRQAGCNLRAAAACAAAALSTPYLMDYDMALVGIGAAFLYVEGRGTAFRRYEQSALAFVWAAPWVSRAAAEHLGLPLGPVATLLLVWFVWQRVAGTSSRTALLQPATPHLTTGAVGQVGR